MTEKFGSTNDKKKYGLKKNDLIHGGSLTCINHEENFVISPFGPHLLKGICQFNIGYFFGILEFEETISTVTYNSKIQDKISNN